MRVHTSSEPIKDRHTGALTLLLNVGKGKERGASDFYRIHRR